MDNIYDLKIKILKSDKGPEYLNSKFYDFIKDKGIRFIHSDPGAHEQNGRAERLNQTLNYCAKTMLNWAKLPTGFWDEAILVSAKLYNLNPHQGNNNLIPDEVFYNKPVDISNLKVFGCKVAFLNNYKKDKFDNNAKQGIFIGYSTDSTGYRIIDLDTNSTITARDVYFFENLPGTINTPFFSEKIIDTLLDSPTPPIEGERTNNVSNSISKSSSDYYVEQLTGVKNNNSYLNAYKNANGKRRSSIEE